MEPLRRAADVVYAVFRPPKMKDAGACGHCSTPVASGDGVVTDLARFCSEECSDANWRATQW